MFLFLYTDTPFAHSRSILVSLASRFHFISYIPTFVTLEEEEKKPSKNMASNSVPFIHPFRANKTGQELPTKEPANDVHQGDNT